tara:strand:- start:1722 stop:2081 length:360 start_codon:yes stop_codon:yes gene_type:complete
MYLTEILITSCEDPTVIINNIMKKLPPHQKYNLKVISKLIHPIYKYIILCQINIESLINLSTHIKKYISSDFSFYNKPFYNYTNIESLKLYLINQLLNKNQFYQIKSMYTSRINKDLLY